MSQSDNEPSGWSTSDSPTSLNILAGKSTLARYLAYCIATGTPFLGAETAAGAVWYLVLEDKRSEVRRHFRALGATGDEPIRFVFGSTADLLGKLTHMVTASGGSSAGSDAPVLSGCAWNRRHPGSCE